jgi:hypothetical protein
MSASSVKPERRCLACGYDRTGVPSLVCSECGVHVVDAYKVALARERAFGLDMWVSLLAPIPAYELLVRIFDVLRQLPRVDRFMPLVISLFCLAVLFNNGRVVRRCRADCSKESAGSFAGYAIVAAAIGAAQFGLWSVLWIVLRELVGLPWSFSSCGCG